jgi:hypothetical protein
LFLNTSHVIGRNLLLAYLNDLSSGVFAVFVTCESSNNAPEKGAKSTVLITTENSSSNSASCPADKFALADSGRLRTGRDCTDVDGRTTPLPLLPATSCLILVPLIIGTCLLAKLTLGRASSEKEHTASKNCQKNTIFHDFLLKGLQIRGIPT